ncbi:hypothetical protein G9A89_009482 [Geosiphon pyriformis]|nr:hypothetical protein G9A89_009482 [Geosiphon pyriformis]
MFFGSEEYHTFWKSSTEKQIETEQTLYKTKKIVIVEGDLNEDLASKLLEKTFATNKEKKCPTATDESGEYT